MKKIFNLILAALVIIGAASCTKNEEVAYQGGESLSFYAEIVNGDTRAEIVKGDGNTWNTIWNEGDNVYVSLPDNDPYTFTYDGEKFTCTKDGVTSLIGQTVIVGPCDVNDDSTAGNRAWSFTSVEVENFGANVKVPLTADTSFFRYTYNGTGEVTITVTPTEKETKVFRYRNGEGVFEYFSSITFSGAANDKFVGFWPQTLSGLNATLSYYIDDVKCKEATINLVPGKVYNLGTLTEPEPKEVRLVPGVWASDGARFAVYQVDTETWVDMNPVSGELGLYSAEVTASKIIFGRMNPSTSENNWENKWNQTGNLTVGVAPNNCYYITGWGETDGEWRTYTATEWAVAGTFSNDDWKTDLKMEKVTDAVYALKSLTLKAYDEFKVKSFGSWDTSLGAGRFAYSTPGYWQTVTLNGSGNIVVDTAGTYDIYFDVDNIRLYIVTAGSDYTTATEQTVNGTEPEQDADAPMLYLKPNVWTSDNARFAAYFFDNGYRWVSMTDSDSDGIYEVAIPTDKSFPKVIFCRMKPDTANDWANKWNQTGDLVIPTDGKNLYTITGWGGDVADGNWSTK